MVILMLRIWLRVPLISPIFMLKIVSPKPAVQTLLSTLRDDFPNPIYCGMNEFLDGQNQRAHRMYLMYHIGMKSPSPWASTTQLIYRGTKRPSFVSKQKSQQWASVRIVQDLLTASSKGVSDTPCPCSREGPANGFRAIRPQGEPCVE